MVADSSSPITQTAVSGSGGAGPLRLLVVDGPDRGAHLDLAPGVYRIGKGADVQLVLSDPLVSREHLLVHVSAHGVHVRDLGSKNGSFLGGTRLTEATIAPGTIVQIGSSKLRLAWCTRHPRRARRRRRGSASCTAGRSRCGRCSRSSRRSPRRARTC